MNEGEQLVIKNLLLDEEYVRKAMPFIQIEYFVDTTGKKLFDILSKYFTEYSAIPTKEALVIEVGQIKDISDDQHHEIVKAIGNIDTEKSEFEWILDTTEKWCKERALYLALMSSIKIAEGNDEQRAAGAIPSILSEALAVTFDNHIGHDYLEDYEERYDFYHQKEEKIPFDLNSLTRLQKVVFLTRLSMLLLQGLVWVSLCSCVIVLVLSYSKVRTFCTLLLRWQRKKLPKG